ncbi:DMT family transporter [Helicobacter mastomyrinus]|uniref:DMT family transporter n=1 Tax=Helicobacter mastomyrinus TaxID=287948 RepID=A0ABZ3F2R6_9HELI|nr:DMT family transporter [uncultured Helicobacter sp.]
MFYIIAFCIGVALAIQAPINAALSKSLSNASLVAALISFSIGTLCLCLLAYAYGMLNTHTLKATLHQEWWKYLGGFLGAFAVFGTILLSPKIGLANMFLLIILGQILTSSVLDHLGAFGLPIKSLSLHKIIGLLIIVAGLFVFFYKDIFKIHT